MDMTREVNTRRSVGTLVALACCALVLSISVAAPALAEEDGERKVIKKVIVHCDGEDCERGEDITIDVESLLDHHGFAWVTGEGPGRMALRTHIGGGYLGVLLAELTPELRLHFGVDESAGVMVSKVVDDSPAARAGLQVGDIVSAIDGKPVAHGNELAHAIRMKKDGESVLMEVWRDRSLMNLTAVVEERKGSEHGMDWKFVVDCDGDEADCSFARRRMHIEHGGDVDACDGASPCEVKVSCESEDRSECECTVNGEATDCAGLPGFRE